MRVVAWVRRKLHRHNFSEYSLVDLPVTSPLTAFETADLTFVVRTDRSRGLIPERAYYTGFVCKKCGEPGYDASA